MTNRLMTLAQLRRAGACQEQRDLFAALFGAEVTVTLELAVTHAGAFDWAWAAGRLLSTPARVEYNKAIAAARAEYNKAIAAAWAEYDKVIAPAWAEYGKAIAAAWAEYDKVIAPAQAEYGKAIAAAWATAYIHDRES